MSEETQAAGWPAGVESTPIGYQGPARHTWTAACDGFHESQSCPAGVTEADRPDPVTAVPAPPPGTGGWATLHLTTCPPGCQVVHPFRSLECATTRARLDAAAPAAGAAPAGALAAEAPVRAVSDAELRAAIRATRDGARPGSAARKLLHGLIEGWASGCLPASTEMRAAVAERIAATIMAGIGPYLTEAASPAQAALAAERDRLAGELERKRALIGRLIDEFAGNIGEIRVYAGELGIDIDAEFADVLAGLEACDGR